MGGRMTPNERIEAFLRTERADLIEQRIWPSNVVVIDNMLSNSSSLADAYTCILAQARPGTFGEWSVTQEAWQRILHTIVDTAAGWSPARVGESREAVRRVAELSDEIAKKARELAALLRVREAHREKHSITGPDDYHPLDVLDLAADRSNQAYLYRVWVAPRLSPIAADFDLKYWPRTADFLDALAELQAAPTEPYDALSRASMSTRQGGSPLEFVRALDEALANLEKYEGIRVELSHRAIAEISNAALALPVDELVTREAVKAARARQRRRG